jgi:hypothetical protein
MPKTYFELPPDQGKTKLYITWRDRRGEQADIVTINFDPQAALAESEKKILEELWTAWIDFRDWNGAMLVYFSHLITYRCSIQEVRYGYNGGISIRSISCRRAISSIPTASPRTPRFI